MPACPGCKCYYGAVFSLSEEYCNKALYLTPHIHSHDWPILIISTHHTQLSHSYTFQIFTVFRYLQVSYMHSSHICIVLRYQLFSDIYRFQRSIVLKTENQSNKKGVFWYLWGKILTYNHGLYFLAQQNVSWPRLIWELVRSNTRWDQMKWKSSFDPPETRTILEALIFS